MVSVIAGVPSGMIDVVHPHGRYFNMISSWIMGGVSGLEDIDPVVESDFSSNSMSLETTSFLIGA